MKRELYLFRGTGREPITSLEGVTRLGIQSAFEFRRHDDSSPEAQSCEYYGARVLKGVTHLHTGMTIIGIPRDTGKGLHGAMLEGICGVDPPEIIYGEERRLGFGLFIRWTVFTRRGELPILGIDYRYLPTESHGVVQDQAQAARVIAYLRSHGFPRLSGVRLLGHAMLERPDDTKWRESRKLHSVRDWTEKGAIIR